MSSPEAVASSQQRGPQGASVSSMRGIAYGVSADLAMPSLRGTGVRPKPPRTPESCPSPETMPPDPDITLRWPRRNDLLCPENYST